MKHMKRRAGTCLALSWLVLLPNAASSEEGVPDQVASDQGASAQGALEVADLEEIKSYQAAKTRFRARALEFVGDARYRLATQKTVQLASLQEGYATRLEDLATAERVRRDGAIARFEQFLGRYDDVGVTSDVRLRLAELYFQRSEDEWLVATDAFYAALEAAGDDLDALVELEAAGEPRIDLTRVVELLDSVVASNRALVPADRYPLLDVAYYMLAFAYADDNSVQHDRDRARAIFRELIEQRPDSDYADAAHLMLGNYAFQDNEYVRSIPEFQAVVDQGPQRLHYAEALYQLAWARYKLSEYEPAMRGFVELLDLSEERRRRTGRPSEFAPDAVAYLALSLSDLADAQSSAPLEQAIRYFDRVGRDRAYRWDVLVELAESLVRYARPREAVEVYAYLQHDPDFRFRPENPDFQDQVVKLLSRGYDADLVAAGEARLEMTERYGERSAWWNANRSNPDAQARARRYIESYLLDVATEVKVRAQESGDPQTYAMAADKYREYLEKFPIADDWFPNQFQMADALYRSHRFEEAAEAFGNLVANTRLHAFGDASLYMLFRTREQLLRDRVGPPDQPAPGAEVERAYTTPGGKEILVYQLLDDQEAFVEAADGVLSHAFGPPVEEIDLRSVVEQNRAKILYLPAQVLYYANRYDEARPRLQKIVKEHPQTDEAAFAANLFLNSYIQEGDNAAIRRWSREFASMRLGSSDTTSQVDQFADTYEKASYMLGTEAYDRGEYAAAAEAYLAFVDEFPESPNVPDALLSAAFNYQRLGRATDANGLYERFIREFPEHPEAKPFYFAIASNYESTFQLEQAIGYYREYVRRFPDDVEAPNAQYMVAFLEEGLGDHAAAARDYEAYAERFPTVVDREEVYFRAGAMYELADPAQALRFYPRYLEAYGVENPDHALEAQWRIAELHRKAGRERQAERATADTVALFDRVVASGGTVGPRGRDLAAAAAFGALQQRFDAITARELSRNEAKDTKLLLDELPVEIAAFDEAARAFVERYLSFEYTTAAVYLQGAVRADYAKLGFSFAPPAGLSGDQEAAYWELLEESLFPEMEKVEQQAGAFFEEVVALARQQKRHAPWVDHAREGLNDLDPSTWPDVKEPLRGAVQAVQPAVIAPILPEPPVEEAP